MRVVRPLGWNHMLWMQCAALPYSRVSLAALLAKAQQRKDVDPATSASEPSRSQDDIVHCWARKIRSEIGKQHVLHNTAC